MFETTVIESRKQKIGIQKYLTLPVSLALHAVVLAGAVFASVWNVTFPSAPPAQVAQYSIAAPPPPPPPPPPPAKAKATPTPVKPVEVPKDIANLAPTIVPEQVPDLPVASGEDEGVEGGVEGGVPGGVVGGVIGGVVGGVVDAPTAPIRVGGDVKAPVVITRVDPVYPEVARKARVQGIVIVEAIIDKTGSVTNVKILKGLPFGLDHAAADAVRRWRFKPGTLNGQAVDVIFNLTVNFKLN